MDGIDNRIAVVALPFVNAIGPARAGSILHGPDGDAGHTELALQRGEIGVALLFRDKNFNMGNGTVSGHCGLAAAAAGDVHPRALVRDVPYLV